ncbi:glycosyltransferase family 4 protein [Pseudomonas sp. ZM23]|uniref:Glycosyltransferase family 4 protein n=1 Tax=Pseudomonas triclosanedens TaxID=2961893 RepID=A0ABY6ZWQ3_9PSED|nr:glycosyltransferase family 4 protein [Pseudomonas triclosanedens]MCP8466859.1 glycosyltransferase family 4 protein [Pseudomonas triclosanedens]MCP8470083.1 glycosyltransferase family 4 protein [Pseudomonas triclosanedens]MCP8477993.1 glycosyltransferase family 4 protein [Pseudomonas triclosanedens]WAI49407.1 glycosyltransferase family 4 protein [Pseudomonas triclosanedens]
MKILFLNTLYAPYFGGGAEVMLQSMVEGLKRRGHEVQVLSTGPESGVQSESLNGVPVLRAGMRNLYWPFSGRRPGPLLRLAWHALDRYNRGMREVLADVLEQSEPDVVVCHNLSGWSIAVWDAIRDAGLPIVQILHDQYLICPRGMRFNKGRHCEQQCGSCALLRRSHAKASATVDVVVGVSRFQLDVLLDAGYFRDSRPHVIYNASPFAPQNDEPAVVAAHRPLRFGFIGTLAPNKGLEWLIDSFQETRCDASLLIAGRGDAEYVNALKSRADPRHVHFVGYRKAGDFFRTIDVAVVPTLSQEPFGLVALEACAHHVPVIASARGGLVEIVRDEFNGLLCEPDRPDSLRDAIQRLAQDPGLRLGLASRARASVESMLSVERMLDEYEALLRHTLLDRGVRHGSAIPVSTL